MPKRQLKGMVISNKPAKTVVVRIDRIKTHPKYKKRYKVSKNYKAHVEGQTFDVGDNIIIEECRPISKDKRWRVVEKINPPIGKPLIDKQELKEENN